MAIPSNLSLDIPFLLSPDRVDASSFEHVARDPRVAQDYTVTGLAMKADRQNLSFADDANRRESVLLELTIERDNKMPICFLSKGARLARAVCKIKCEGVNFKGGTGKWAGTGFLISPNVLLTNHHVLNSAAVAKTAFAIFNYEVDEDDKSLETKAFSINPEKLFITSKVGELDCTFVWVEGQPGDEFGFVRPSRRNFQVLNDEPANIVQHPEGNYKAVAIQENKVTRQGTVLLHYSADTMPGSSGSPVFNNRWELVALHHASAANPNPAAGGSQFDNEGIKMTAIATFLERNAGQADAANDYNTVLRLFGDIDAVPGYFGTLGRQSAQTDAVEAIRDTYKGEDQDVDVGFWNVEWFNRSYDTKYEAVARILVDMNVDVWGLEDVSPGSVRKLVGFINHRYLMSYECAFSEPNADEEKQTTAVVWNTKTLTLLPDDQWIDSVKSWFTLDSRQFSGESLEAVEGKIFDRYPGLFHFVTTNRTDATQPFDFYLVPLHLKATNEGSKRRQMAAKILAAAVQKMIDEGHDKDWILGGNFNAELATNDFNSLRKKSFQAMSATDEADGAFSYLKRPKSLIDHVFLSHNLGKTVGDDNYFIVAKDRTFPDYVQRVSNHRPVLVRINLKGQANANGQAVKPEIIKELQSYLGSNAFAGAA